MGIKEIPGYKVGYFLSYNKRPGRKSLFTRQRLFELNDPEFDAVVDQSEYK